jgi:hypothetical protein
VAELVEVSRLVVDLEDSNFGVPEVVLDPLDVDQHFKVSDCVRPTGPSSGGADQVTDASGVAVGWVEAPGSFDETMQFAPEGAQLGDPAVEVCRSGSKEIEDMATRGIATVAERQDAADLAEGQSDRLGSANEGKTVESGVVIVPVARRRAPWWTENSDAFVVTDGLGGDAGLRRQFSDAQLSS